MTFARWWSLVSVAAFALAQGSSVSSSTDVLSLVQAHAVHRPGTTTKKSRRKPEPLFVDITGLAFPQTWYRWNHSGYPRSHQGTPSFPDLNGDGILDYFYHNHYEALPATAWDMGIGSPGSVQSLQGPYYESVGESLITCTEPAESKWRYERGMDNHGTAILDIDRDGLLDIYMAVGGGEGKTAGPPKNAVLMWGTAPSSKGRLQGFSGGRDASEFSNLHNPDSRGRFNYFADFNNDGLLDVVFSNEPRMDDIHAPGFAMINQGNRKFEPHKEISEYFETAVLHDADGDGHAEEFVLARRDCGPKQCKYVNDKECKRLIAKNRDWYDFCLTRPEGTTAVYKYDETSNAFVMMSPSLNTTTFGAELHGMSMQTGDFDGDELADLAILYKDSIRFHYSSKRKLGELPVGTPSETVEWNSFKCDASAFRAADLDMDGQIEFVVLCETVRPTLGGPSHMLITRGPNNEWVFKEKEELGAFLDYDLVRVKDELVDKTCKEDYSNFPGYMRKMCEEFHGGDSIGHYKMPRSMGLSVVDWDNDGFLDMSITYDLGSLLLLKNNYKEAGNASHNRFIAIKLQGTDGNEYGVGATVLLRSQNMGPKGTDNTTQLKEIYSASHETDWLGTRDDRIIFGLGVTGVPVELEVRWPGKQRKTTRIEDKAIFEQHISTMTNLLVIREP